MSHFFYKILSFFIFFIFLLLASSVLLFYFSGMHKNVFINNDKIFIKDFNFLKYSSFKKLNIIGYKIKDNNFYAKKIEIEDFHLNTNFSKSKSKITNHKIIVPKKIFFIMHKALDYFDLYHTDMIDIKKVFLNNKKVLESFQKNGKNIKVILPDKRIFFFKMLSKFKIELLLDKNKKIIFVIKDNFLSFKVFVHSYFLFSGKFINSDFLSLNDVKVNSKYFKATNILNDLKFYSLNDIHNEYIKFNGKNTNINIPWVGYDNYNLFNTEISIDLEKNMIVGSIQTLIIGNDTYRNVKVNIDLNNLSFNFILSDRKKINFKIFISKEDNYYVHVANLQFNKISIKNEDFFMSKNGFSSSMFDVVFIDKNHIKIILKSKIDDFIDKNYHNLFSKIKKVMDINSLSKCNLNIYLNPKGLEFSFILKNIILKGKKQSDGISFLMKSKKLFMSDKIILHDTSISSFYRFKSNIIEIKNFDSHMTYNTFSVHLFNHHFAFFDISENELSIPDLNDAFFVGYKNKKLSFISNSPYKFTNEKFGSITFDDIKLNYIDNQLTGKISVLNSDITLAKKTLDILTKRKNKNFSNDNNESLKLTYKIYLTNSGNKIKKIKYLDKNAEIFLDKINVLFTNSFYSGEIVIKKGSFDFQKKKYYLKKSNINIVQNKIILGINSFYKDDKIKVDIGVFGKTDNNNLFINLSSQPSYPESTIINYLLFNGSLENDNSTFTENIINVGISKIKNYLHIPIDSIKILERDNGQTAYQVSKTLSKKIRVQYTKDEVDNDFEIFYKINNNLNINSYTNGKTNGIRVEWNYEY